MALTLLVLGVPTAAHPMGLAQLLRLPLEQLLRLEITATHAGAAPIGGESRGH